MNIIIKSGNIYILFLLFGILFLPGCFTNKPIVIDERILGEIVNKDQFEKDIQVKNTRLVSMEGDRLNWELEAETASINQKTKKAYAENIKCTFYDENKKIVFVIKSKGAEINLAEKSVLFQGEIKGTSPKGEILKVSKMRWDGKNKKLIGWDGVVFIKGNSCLTADKIEADPETKRIILTGKVDTWIRDNKPLIKD